MQKARTGRRGITADLKIYLHESAGAFSLQNRAGL
jgi:hypothetical protein